VSATHTSESLLNQRFEDEKTDEKEGKTR
jgi:hypothetical protein